MAFLFKRNPKTPGELVRALNDNLSKLDYSTNSEKTQDECTRYLKQLRMILHGDEENEPQVDQIPILSQELILQDCVYNLVASLNKLEFDSRKDVVIIFSMLLRRNNTITIDYLINTKSEIITMLMTGPEHPEIGIISGQILRECIKYEQVNQYVLYHASLWNFFHYVEIPIFELATDSMMSLNEMLTVHKRQVAEFLNLNYEKFILSINKLIDSDNYVTKRQSVKLLNDLVSSKWNTLFIKKYYEDAVNLKKIMRLLSERSKNLQLEGFNILKFFIANPRRSQRIDDLLIKNKSNFQVFFKNFDVISFHDQNLVEERDYVWKEIQKLK